MDFGRGSNVELLIMFEHRAGHCVRCKLCRSPKMLGGPVLVLLLLLMKEWKLDVGDWLHGAGRAEPALGDV